MTNSLDMQKFLANYLIPPRMLKSMVLSCGNKGLQPLVMPDIDELNGELFNVLGYTLICLEVTS
jgi:hypothetical protein